MSSFSNGLRWRAAQPVTKVSLLTYSQTFIPPSEIDLMLCFNAALNEVSSKELELATDPECSIILERMLHSMDDFALRVFMDRLSGSSVFLHHLLLDS